MPILFFLLFALLDLGWAIVVQASLAHAAGEGARVAVYGATSEAEQAAIRAAVCEQVVVSSLDCGPGGAITITQAAGPPATVTVKVTHTHVAFTPWVGAFLPGGGLTLAGGATALAQ